MRRLLLFTVALAIFSEGVAQVAEPSRPQTVEILSGGLRLKGFLRRPAGRGPFPAVVFNHGRSDTPRQHNLELGQTLEQAAQIFGPVFVRLVPCAFGGRILPCGKRGLNVAVTYAKFTGFRRGRLLGAVKPKSSERSIISLAKWLR